jgi:predicted dehydrogenase
VFRKNTDGYFDIAAFSPGGTVPAYRLDPAARSVTLTGADIVLDAGGFGKGYALDRVRKLLADAGVANALVNFGDSSVAAVGSHPFGDCWQVSSEGDFALPLGSAARRTGAYCRSEKPPDGVGQRRRRGRGPFGLRLRDSLHGALRGSRRGEAGNRRRIRRLSPYRNKATYGIMDRREFMKRVGTLGAAGLALSAVPWLKGCTAAGQEEIRGGRVRFGVIGTGSRGQYHMRNLLSVLNAGITALCDNYAHNLDKASAIAPGAKRYDDYRRLLEDPQVDAVIIAAPLHLHYRMALDAFAAGKHVLCEKAMAYTMEECFEMYRKGRASGRVFFVGQQRLFDPKYIRIMDSVRKGELGPVVNVRNYWYRNNDWRRKVPSPELERHINWRLYREYSRGLMTELACHQLQNGTWAMGMLPTQVMGTGNIVYWKDGREVFDSVSTIYTFPNGVNMTFESVIANKHFGMGEQILCKEGTVDLANGRLYMETPRRKSGIRQLVGEIEQGVFSNSVFAGTSWSAEGASADPGIAIMPEAVEGDGSLEMLRAFCHSVLTNTQPPNVLEEAYYASVFCLLGDEAILQNKILTLPEEIRIDYI